MCWRHLFPVAAYILFLTASKHAGLCSGIRCHIQDALKPFFFFSFFFCWGAGLVSLINAACRTNGFLKSLASCGTASIALVKHKMHFRNFNYSFSSLIACVADSDVFNQAETRVCFIFCGLFLWTTGILKYVAAVSNCLKYLDTFLTCEKISVWCKGFGS